MIWMTPRRLEWALRLYGTELAVWPSAERDAALSLLRRCGKARQLMAVALVRDDAAEDALLADAALLDRMQERLRQRLAAPSPAGPAVRWGVLAACAAAGLCLGVATVDAEQQDLFAAVQAIAIEATL